jgi:copper transport protein
MRPLATLLAVVAALLSFGTAQALGHAYLVSSIPTQFTIPADAPTAVTITFSEAVQLLRGEDLTVVDRSGRSVAAGPGRVTADRRVIEVPLQRALRDGTYTVRYQVIGSDSHVIPGLFTFGVGVDTLEPPYLGDGSQGPSETGPWGVSARFLEMVTLGGLFGLIVFRLGVWVPAWRRSPGVPRDDRARLVTWWRDTHWMIFGVLALAAMLAQAYGLVVQSASALGVGVWDAVRDTAGISSVLSQTDFGTHVQVRGALLFVLFVAGAIQFMREYGNGRTPKPATVGGGRIAALIMAGLVLAVILSISSQGHARVTEQPLLQIAAQAAHIAAAAIWIAGLALVMLVLARAPRVAPGSGRTVAGHSLLAFSALATWAVIAIFATGLLRSIGELSDPAELWETAYGQSILIKLGLLVPLIAIALYNRRIVAALRRVEAPNRATLALVRRTVGAELATSLVIVLVATLLVAQVPGG